MHPELAHHRKVGRHLGGMGRRDRHRLAADQNIERPGVKDQPPLGRIQRLPELPRRILRDPVQIDHPGMRLGPIPDRPRHREVNRESEPLRDHRHPIDQRHRRMQGRQRRIIQHRRPATQPQLVQPHPRSHQHREGPRTDLHPQRPGIPFGHAVELRPPVDDCPRQQVQPPSRGLGIRHRRHALRQPHPLQQRDQIDAALLQHRTPLQGHFMHDKGRKPILDPPPGPGQKGRTDAVGLRAKSQVKARGLNLRGQNRAFRRNPPLGNQLAQRAVGQDAGVRHRPPQKLNHLKRNCPRFPGEGGQFR